MDRRALAALFRDRLRQLLAGERGGPGAFLRATGIDRSALSQFLNPAADRLPRAETLRRIAEARGVTLDWLLGLSNAPAGRQVVAPSVQIETASWPGGGSPLEAWRREARGSKLRYVPAALPDMLVPPEAAALLPPAARPAPVEPLAGALAQGEIDVEIAMPGETLADLAAGAGIWRGIAPEARRALLLGMAAEAERLYPALRLHLFDGREVTAAPLTIFGRIRAALYLGDAYLVVTAAGEVAALSRLFDGLLRRATTGPDRAAARLAALAG